MRYGKGAEGVVKCKVKAQNRGLYGARDGGGRHAACGLVD
jgi:hypothetical protein